MNLTLLRQEWKVVEEYGDNLRSRRRWGLDPKHKAMLLMIDVE